MNQEIKQRIEQIKNGEVPHGYKKTKIGIVPNEWEEKHLKNYSVRITRKNTEKNTNVLTISAQYGLINQNKFFTKEVASQDKSNYYLIERGEFAYNKSYSNGYPFGAIKKLKYYDKGILSPLYICFSIDSNKGHIEYFEQYFENGNLNREINAFAQEGARNHGLLNISVDDFFNSYVVIPPLNEQQKISDILSTQDKVIELKEKLLKEKEKQKKYLVQSLVTGKKRLKGFNGEWKKVKIGSFLVESKEIEQNVNLDKRLTVKLNLKGVDKRNIKTIEMEDATKQYKRRAGQFIYGKQNLHKGAFGIIPKHLDGYQSSTDLPAFDLSPNVSVEWFFYYLSRETYYKQLENIATGTGSKRVQPQNLYKLNINLPPLEEQKAIAEILTTADRELKLLQEELEEEKRKKKALMQLLLTGIVRIK